MKKTFILAISILLMFAMFTGCTNQKPDEDKINDKIEERENDEIKEDENTSKENKSPKEIIEERSYEAIKALSKKDMKTLSNIVHPTKGVRFTPYTYVDVERDLVFDKEKISNFFSDENVYMWGYFDGTGDEIKLKPSEYYERFIYSKDFINAEKIGYNEVLSFGNMLENQFKVYDDPIIVEYYFSGFNPEYAGMDWRSLRLVFEEYKGNWYLVGIINNEWTI
ncbi:hypothetical protein SAMN05661008_00748 [Alkalithermobacter thermoalcaliphilus JW-YL-7 = DSM 7308]|uniref:Lipoprotein n=1 Tax=Alkalithermobacter thermoalcaliphilus JW-YL-7 = DSM 7308 TaxID=1121328 RepID=A0A150FSH7_CLOPD|nr:hypothetical protein JWYL7_1629 [[Clostridium] paradoxum JW-YL-7 = DSM 7308]SHK70858.1 hypothetical protein SAMN05661008_00748 [[Clostridium] paradoxum JW-YL-7 = DSM 7308]